MSSLSSRIGILGIASLLMAGGHLVRVDETEEAEPAQTNAIDPNTSPPPPESRQVRRARERREAKGRFA